jgi:hypothetical protein
LEEVIRPHVQQLRDPKQQIRAYALFAVLVGVEVAPINSQIVAELSLGNPERPSSRLQSAANGYVASVLRVGDSFSIALIDNRIGVWPSQYRRRCNSLRLN